MLLLSSDFWVWSKEINASDRLHQKCSHLAWKLEPIDYSVQRTCITDALPCGLAVIWLRPNISLPLISLLFFFWFSPFVGVRLVYLSLHCKATFVIYFHWSLLLAFALHFSSSSALLISLFTQSSHLSSGLPRFLQPSCFFVSDLFGNLSSVILTMCPAHLIRLLRGVAGRISGGIFLMNFELLTFPCIKE